MGLLDIFTILVMALIGVIVGGAVVGIAELLGIAGWIAGLCFAGLVFALIYVSDRLREVEMTWTSHLLAGIFARDQDLAEIDDAREARSRRMDYFGFLAGAIVGILGSLVLTPMGLLELLPI